MVAMFVCFTFVSLSINLIYYKRLDTCCSFVGGLSIGSVIVSLQSESGSRLDSPHLESAVDEKLDSCSIFIRTFLFRTFEQN